ASMKMWASRGEIYAMAEQGSLGPFSIEAPVAPTVATASVATQIDSPEAWLLHPSQPSLSVPIGRPNAPTWPGDITVAPGTDDQRVYAARQAIYQPSGRREAVVFPLGYRSAGNWTLNLLTQT